MFNITRGGAKPVEKPAARPSPYPYAPVPSATGASGSASAKSPSTASTASRPDLDAVPGGPTTAPPVALPGSEARAIGPDSPGSQLVVGLNIKLRGVEISECDVLIIEGHVEATVNSKAMQIAKPGTLKGVAVIDVAEIDGEFSGELTAHAKLIVRGTGRVSGKIRYGRLIVSDGGEISGDVQRIDPAPTVKAKVDAAMPEVRARLSPQPTG